DELSGDDLLALEDAKVSPPRNQFLVLLALLVPDDEPALALRLLAEADGPRQFREDRRILRTPRLEKVRDSGQAARDVARLRALLRQPRDHVADEDPSAVLHADYGAGRQRIGGRNIRVRERDRLAVVVDQLRGR